MRRTHATNYKHSVILSTLLILKSAEEKIQLSLFKRFIIYFKTVMMTVLRTLEKSAPSHRRHHGYLSQPPGKMNYEIANLIIAGEAGTWLHLLNTVS